MKRSLLVLSGLGVVIAVASGLIIRDTGDATTAVDAAETATLVGADDVATDIEPGLRPVAGTYEYVGSGHEHLTLLGGSTHEFPERFSAIVQLDADDDCAWRLDLVLIKEHREQRRYCTTMAGTVDAGFDRTTSFLGREQTSKYACIGAGRADAYRLLASAAAGDSWAFTCTEKRGGKVTFAATNADTETLQIGGQPAATTHVRIVGTQRDKSTGDERGDWWLLASGLPARIRTDRTLTTSAGPLGTLTTTEQLDYELASLDPQ